MKISYQHPITGNRTSVTLNDRVLRLWAIINNIDVYSNDGFCTDDFLYESDSVKFLKLSIERSHLHYLKGVNTFPTFVSYFENAVFTDIEIHILGLKTAILNF